MKGKMRQKINKAISMGMVFLLVISYFYVPFGQFAFLLPASPTKSVFERIAGIQPGFPSALAATTTVIITNTGLTSWSVPSDWNDSANRIEVIGAGGGGDSDINNKGSGGGGGGGYTSIENVNLPESTSVGIAIGTGGPANTAGGDTYVCNSTANCASIAGTAVVAGARGGTPGNDAVAGSGGAVGVPTTGTNLKRYTGGNGGAGNNTGDLGGGGGGGAGPGGGGGAGAAGNGGGGGGGGNGSGGAAEAGGTDGACQGGDGPDGTGGGATAGANGTANTGGGGACNNGITTGGTGGTGNGTSSGWGAGYGGGGGGGGVDDGIGSQGGGGGLYGGGGGGSYTGGSGAQGIIVISYTPFQAAKPTVQTNAATNVNGDSATLNGEITATGGAAASTCGYAWGTDEFLRGVGVSTTTDSVCPGGIGAFSKDITGLSSATTYYFRAYATNSAGNGLGGILNFTTENPTERTILSTQNQRFTIGQDPVFIAPITISASSTAGIHPEHGMQIAIATTSGFGMEWDTTIGTAVITGTASGKVSSSVSYNGASILYITVSTDWAAFDSITISGLKFKNFTAPAKSGTGALVLYANGSSGLPAAATSTELVTIGYGKVIRINKPPNYLTLGSGLVGHWTFDGKDMITNVADKSGQGNHGNIIGMSATGTTTVPGKLGQALSFDGTDDYVRVATSSSLTNFSQKSVFMWVYPTLNAQKDIYSGGYWVSPFGDLFQKGSTDANTQMYVKNSDATAVTSAQISVPVNKWTHIGYSWNGSTVTWYLNGVSLSGVSSLTGTVSGMGANVFIGGRSTAAWLAGSIDDVRVYNRALTADEAVNLYKVGQAKVGASAATGVAGQRLSAGLVGHWTFDGKDMMSNVRDKSGQGNHGSLIVGTTGNTSTTTAPGKLGQALSFDGTDDYVNAGLGANITGAVTVSAWVKSKSNMAQDFVVGRGNASGGVIDSRQYILDYYEVNRLGFNVSNGVSIIGTKAPANSTPDGSWWHATGVYDGVDTVRFYVNGVQVESSTSAGFGALNSAAIGLGIGNRQSGGALNFYDGSLDDVRIYDRALSASEVLELYRLGNTRVTR